MITDFNPRIVRQTSCGVTYNCVIADKVGELWYDTPRWPEISVAEALALPVELDHQAAAAWKEMGILRDHVVRPGDRIVECGCHHGITTILLASWTGHKGFVYAFDAVPLNAVIARRNLELNQLNNAAVYCAAIGGRTQIVSCVHESNVIVKHGEGISKSSTIMVGLKELALGRIDVLKLDVEGCELEILQEYGSLLKRVPRLEIELHSDLLPPGGTERILSILKHRQLHVLWPDGRFEQYAGQSIAERVHLFAL